MIEERKRNPLKNPFNVKFSYGKAIIIAVFSLFIKTRKINTSRKKKKYV